MNCTLPEFEMDIQADRTINSPWGGFITIEDDEQLSFAPTVDESEDPRPLCTCDMDVILRKGCQCGGR